MAPPRAPATDETTRADGSTGGPAPGHRTGLALTLVWHPDAARAGQRALLDAAPTQGTVDVSRATPMFARRGEETGAPLADDRLSRRPFHVTPLPDGGARLDLAGTSIPVAIRGQAVSQTTTFSAADLQRGVVLELGTRVALLLHTATTEAAALLSGGPGEDEEIGGDSDAIRRVLWEIHRVADLPLPVLLRGETGSGKELVARAVHRMSPRRAEPFVAVNLGALTPTLAVSELFGAERGAFTGAVKKQVGYFEQARGGTLFLDEIGEAPVELQVALLRVLETGEMQTVGAQQARKADVRIVAATDADLEAKVRTGSFRAPLLNRLGAYEIRVPPLRERRDDVGRLLARFLGEELLRAGEPGRIGPTDKPWLSAAIAARLADFDWPGNVRQLRNVVRQLVIANRGRDRAELTPALASLLAAPPPSSLSASSLSASSPSASSFSASSPSASSLSVSSPPSSPPASWPAPFAASASVVPSLPRPAAVPEAVSTENASTLPPSALSVPALAPRRRPAEVTEAELGEALRASRWDLAAAAQRLRISRASMYLLIERHPQFRTGGDLDADEILRAHSDHGGHLGRMADALRVSERALARRLREMNITYEPSR